jgi:hypothetical protein
MKTVKPVIAGTGIDIDPNLDEVTVRGQAKRHFDCEILYGEQT